MPESPARAPTAIGYAGLAAAVLLAEYLLVSIKFDAQPLIARGGVWGVFGYSGRAGLVLVLSGLAALLLGYRLRVVQRVVARSRPSWLVLHGVLFAGFLVITWQLLVRSLPATGPSWLWLAGWLLIGLASTAALLAGLFELSGVRARALLAVLLVAFPAGALAWAAGESSKWLWQPLGRATLGATEGVLALFSAEVVADPLSRTLGFAGFQVVIADECSGFEGMGLVTVLLPAYLFAFRRELRFPNAWLLLPLGIAAMWLGNIARLVALMGIGAYLSPALAEGGFHSKAGWVLFCAIALALGSVSRKLAFFSRVEASADAVSDNPSAAYLMPLLALLATALVTGLFAKDFDRLYGLRIATAASFLYAYRRFYRELSWGWSWPAIAVGALVGLAWLLVPSAPSAASLAAERGSLPAGWVVLRALGSVSVVPLCEELAFRGYLLRWLIARDFTRVSPRAVTPWALLGSSLAFGALHERWLLASLSGLAFALLQLWRGRFGDAVVAHAVSNAAIALWVVIAGDFSHWL